MSSPIKLHYLIKAKTISHEFQNQKLCYLKGIFLLQTRKLDMNICILQILHTKTNINMIIEDITDINSHHVEFVICLSNG